MIDVPPSEVLMDEFKLMRRDSVARKDVAPMIFAQMVVARFPARNYREMAHEALTAALAFVTEVDL